MNRIYLCIDLKTFYASVECVERSLDPFKTDLIVADPSRGKGSICLAISPKMKQRGIKNRCRVWEIPKNVKPIVAKPRMKKYIEYSAKVYKIYLKYISKEDIHPYSIDEMFLDITNYLKLYNKTPEEIAQMIINDIKKTLGITATCGIGTNLYLAKIALDIMAKHEPKNIAFLDEEKFKEKLWHHTPLTDFWRINKGTEERLKRLKIKDMYDITQTDENILYKEFGINAEYLIDHAKGIEPCTIKDIKNYKTKSKSISNSQILFRDYNYKEARIVLTEMIDNLVLDLISKNLSTKNIGIIIGYTKNEIKPSIINFKLEKLTNSYTKILERALKEYDKIINKNIKIRRIGISFKELDIKKHEQLDLFNNYKNELKDEKLEKTVANLKNKYGKNIILRANSYEEGATQITRNKLIGGHNAQ